MNDNHRPQSRISPSCRTTSLVSKQPQTTSTPFATLGRSPNMSSWPCPTSQGGGEGRWGIKTLHSFMPNYFRGWLTCHGVGVLLFNAHNKLENLLVVVGVDNMACSGPDTNVSPNPPCRDHTPFHATSSRTTPRQKL